MNLLLSWNLFIIAIFIVIIAYSYIIGINKTVKTIIASYLAILAADGLGNIFRDYFLISPNFQEAMKLINLNSPDETLISIKVIIFVSAVVILTVKGAYEVKLHGRHLAASQFITTAIFGFLNAGLIISTLLVYVSGSSLIQKINIPSNIVELYTTSTFVKGMVDYYDFWFSIPVVVIIGWSVFFDHRED
jgi:hypothetical protein